jgi:hypothetical protein
MAMTKTGWAALGAGAGGAIGGLLGFFFADKAKPDNKLPIAIGTTALGGIVGATLLSYSKDEECPKCLVPAPATGATPLTGSTPPAGAGGTAPPVEAPPSPATAFTPPPRVNIP